MSKNAECWIRHRGGKCPVEAGVLVDVRYRDGDIHHSIEALASPGAEKDNWIHETDKESSAADCDIMAYRLHKPAEQVEACSKPELQINLPDGYGEIYNAQAIEHGPLQWRDRIAEIDATTQALTTERAELVQKLASEGFALIWRVVEPVEDMGDPNKWKRGDVLYCNSSDTTGKQFIEGSLYVFESYTDGCSVRVEQDSTGKPNGMMPYALRWHSRPSA